jgi:hypothetical protein
MSLFQKLFGGETKKPEDLADIAACNAALAALRREREEIEATRKEIVEKRKQALLNDEPDAILRKMEAEFEKTSCRTNV